MYPKAFFVDDVPTIANDDVFQLPNALLIDVRRPEEYVGELGHIKGTKLVTLGPDLENFIANTNKEEVIIFICRSGARSANATLLARGQGFQNVYNMQGGMLGWNQQGKEAFYDQPTKDL